MSDEDWTRNASEQHGVREPTRRARVVPIGVAAFLVVAVIGTAATVLVGNKSHEASVRPERNTVAAGSVEGREIGKPVIEDAPDGLVTAAGADEFEQNGTSEQTQTITDADVIYEVPEGRGWAISSERAVADRRYTRELRGPDGQVIRIIRTPNDEAQPDPAKVVSSSAFGGVRADDARLHVLRNFPTDECRERRCDDYVLNDVDFGGVAILASDSGGPASSTARRIATSLRALADE